VNLYLDEVLVAQERLADTESDYLRAQTTYNLALMHLKRAMGTLLKDEQITRTETCDGGLPTTLLDKRLTAPTIPPPPASHRLPD
jgi:hypothetical protein